MTEVKPMYGNLTRAIQVPIFGETFLIIQLLNVI